MKHTTSPVQSWSNHPLLFMPIHDVLSQRDARRIRRTGLSEEMNRIQTEKRQQEKDRKSAEREIEQLRDMVKNLESASANPSPAMRNPSTFASIDPPLPLPAVRNTASFPSANNALPAMRNISTYSRISQVGDRLVETQETTPPLSDPVEPDMEDVTFGPDNTNDNHAADDADAMSAVSFGGDDDHAPFDPMEGFDYDHDHDDSRLSLGGEHDNESEELRMELSHMKSEKESLMEAWRSLSTKEKAMDDNSSSELGGDLHEIVDTYRKTLTQYSDAIESLNNLQSRLNEHGFSGTDALDTVNNIAKAFHDARLDLERCVPGGVTQSPKAKDWPSVLRGLVQKMQTMASQAEQKGQDLVQSEEKVKSLQGQFDEQLRRLQSVEAEMDITRMDNERLYEEKDIVINAFDEETRESDTRFKELSVSFAKEVRRRIELQGDLCKYNGQSHSESERREQEMKGLNDRITDLRTGLEKAQRTIGDMKTEKSHLENELRGFKNRFSQTKVNKMYQMAQMMMQSMDEWREPEPRDNGGGDGDGVGDGVAGKNNDAQKGCTLNTSFAMIGSEPITPSTRSALDSTS